MSTALLAVSLIVFLVTFNIKITLFILLAVILVIYFMAAIIHFWGLTLSNMAAMNMIFALGIAIDYSVHIAHKYLVVKPADNEEMTN